MALNESMILVCEACQASFRIPEGKIPPGKAVSVSCPKCRHRISFTTAEAEKDGEAPAIIAPPAKAGHGGASLVFSEEKDERALVCVEDPAIRTEICKILEGMDYQVAIAEAAHDALKTLRMHTCHLVIVCESFGEGDTEPSSVLVYLERLPMAIRRYMFVVMASRRHGTLDSMEAFLRSVNLVMNVRHVLDLERLLKQGLAGHKYFYEIFLESMKEQEMR